MPVKIVCIVEGHGDVIAVPILIRRIVQSLCPELQIDTPRPIRVHRSKVVKPGELERRVELAASRTGRRGAIFIILDSDDDCPAKLGPELLKRALQVQSNLPIAVVLAKCEFEAWFLAAAESLRGQRGLKNDLQSPSNPEGIRDAKGWLSSQMGDNKTYDEVSDQPTFTARFDFEQARHTDSFDKCYRDIVRLLHELQDNE